MKNMKVKICGHRTKEDARRSVKLGADFIGVIVDVPVNTKRKVSVDKAAQIIQSINPPARGVMVIMPGSIENAKELYEAIKAPFVQLHGDESAEFLKELKGRVPAKIIKTIHVGGPDAMRDAKKHAKFADALLLDTATEKAGGSGIVHDWEISRRIVKEVQIPVLLAGGLTPKNMKNAIVAVGPYGVDVASGVEDAFGNKDFKKVKEFIFNAKSKIP